MTKRKILKQGLLAGTGILYCAVSTAFALDNVVKLGAVIEVQGIHYNNNGRAEQKKISTHQKKYGFYSSGNFLVDYQLVTDTGIKYGTKIGLEQTTRNDRGTPLSIYIESEYGKIEAGSDKSAAKKMRITGYTSSCATGNGWDAFIIASPKSGVSALVPYVTNFCSFLDSKTRTSRLTDYSRKITYFTPKFGSNDHAFQVGVSYIPDTSNAGHNDLDKQHLHTPVSPSQYKFAIKDGVAYGVTYEGKFSDLLSAKVAFAGELGKPVAFDKNDNDAKSDIKFKKLNTYNIGGQVRYDQFSVAASYMNYNKSLTNAAIDTLGRNTSIYSAGMKYQFHEGKYAASVNHFHSDHHKNKLDATSVGIDYIITSGIKTYAQVTYYQTRGHFIMENVVKSDKSRGTIVILGGKIIL